MSSDAQSLLPALAEVERNPGCKPEQMVAAGTASIRRGVRNRPPKGRLVSLRTQERPGLAEFSNAWIKDKIGLREYLVRGLAKAGWNRCGTMGLPDLQ